MIRQMVVLGSLMGLAAVVGCSAEESTRTATAPRQPSAEGAAYLLSVPPEDPEDVISMREEVEDDQEVVVVGRIGGSRDPWVEGVAAFSLVDRSLAACTDIPGDKCPTPWDYCCVTDRLPASTTLVKVVDEQGELVSTGAQELLGLSELQTVVVQGKARKDDSGNVTILARGIYVDPRNPGQVKRDGVDGGHDHDHAHDHDHDHGTDAQHDVAPESAEGEQDKS